MPTDASSVLNAFSGKQVLVTGHTGFKGAWMSAWLRSIGATVSGLSLAPDEAQEPLFSLVGEATFEHSILGDIVDAAVVDAAFEVVQPDVVFHLAAQPLVRLSYEKPVETYATNVMGTAHVLDAVRRNQTPVVVCITTDKCYENVDQIWPYRETDPMGGWDPYSASKGAAELIIASFRRSFFGSDSGIACASPRGGNVVGGGDHSADRLVPDLYRSMVVGEDLVIRRPDATRPWQHVLEALSGYLALGSALLHAPREFDEAWNFGPDPAEHTTVLDFLEAMCAQIGETAPRVRVERDGPHEAARLSLDVTKAAERLQWVPQLSIEERVSLTADWFRRESASTLERSLLTEQISWFEDRWRSAR